MPIIARQGKSTMGEQFLDDLARGLDDGTISRRRALKLVGGAALGAALMPILPKKAEALTRRFRRRCRSLGGAPLAEGNCHCAMTCTTPVAITCHSSNICECHETVSGKGFCTDQSVPVTKEGCSTSADCPTGTVCIMVRGCPSTISCTSSANCPSNYACIRGTCQNTFCMSPCPT